MRPGESLSARSNSRVASLLHPELKQMSSSRSEEKRESGSKTPLAYLFMSDTMVGFAALYSVGFEHV